MIMNIQHLYYEAVIIMFLIKQFLVLGKYFYFWAKNQHMNINSRNNQYLFKLQGINGKQFSRLFLLF
jgi:hypothetical protein